MSQRAWIQFSYFVRVSTGAARECRQCVLFFDLGPGQLLTVGDFAQLTALLRAGGLTVRTSRVGTGRRGRDRVFRPDGMLALQYHLMGRIAEKLNLPRPVRLQKTSTAMRMYHVASAWGLDRASGHWTVRTAQRAHRTAAMAIINRLDDDEARGLFVQVNAIGVEFAKASTL